MPDREIEAAEDAAVLPRAITEAIEAYGHAMFGAGEWTEDDDAPYCVLSAAAGVARRRLVAAIAGALGARDAEIARLRQCIETAEPAWYECPDCGFRYDAAHTDAGGGYSCPACGEERAADARDLLRGDLATAERERDGALESLREITAQKEHWFEAALAAEAQVRRLRHAARELDLLAESARWLAEERDRLRAAGALLRDVARECTVEFEDSRMSYVVVQCDRHLWDAVQRAAPAEGAA